GELTSIVSDNVQMAEDLFTHLVSIIAGGIATMCLLAIIMAMIDWQLALIMIATLPVGFGFMLMFRQTFARLSRSKSAEMAKAASHLLEYVQGIKLIRSFGLVGDKFERLNQSLTRLRDLSIRIEMIGGMAIIGLGLVLEAGFLLTLGIGAYAYMGDQMSAPVLIAMLILAQRFYAPIIDLTTFIAEASYIRRNMERIDTILDAAPLKEAHTPKKPTVQGDMVQ
ncbi:MAG: ABC transporter ATP-binding protein/permease, partial [Cohaesibacter sp.]|nr:ABC transporter ATP-binding protein/permease [Cohaesibacter sp.]